MTKRHKISEKEAKILNICHACEKIIITNNYIPSGSSIHEEEEICNCNPSDMDALIKKHDWKNLFKNKDWLAILKRAQLLSKTYSFLKDPLSTIIKKFPKQTKELS